MKPNKLVLSAFVTVTFLGYSLALRHQASNTLVIKPSTTTTKPTTTTQPSSTSSAPTTSNTNTTTTASGYKNGTYTGSLEDAFYGNVQVSATIQNGKITDVKFLQYPSDSPHSQSINQQATPLLQQEAIQAQTSQVNIISGATDTSQAFIQSLSTALGKAQG